MTYTDPKDSVHKQLWPEADVDAIRNELIQFVVQVNGKVRDIIAMSKEDAMVQSKAEQAAKGSIKLQKFLDAPAKKVIFIPGKVINFVI